MAAQQAVIAPLQQLAQRDLLRRARVQRADQTHHVEHVRDSTLCAIWRRREAAPEERRVLVCEAVERWRRHVDEGQARHDRRAEAFGDELG